MEFYKIACPFCKSQTIVVVHRPPTLITKSCRGSGTTRSSSFKTKDEIRIISGCSNCGKTKEEIEKALKHGKEPSREEVIKRMREAGLDPTKLK
jgi:phage FluMu protein Com